MALDHKRSVMHEVLCMAERGIMKAACFVLEDIRKLERNLEEEGEGEDSETKLDGPQDEVLDTDEDSNSTKLSGDDEEEDNKEPQRKKTKYDDDTITGHEGYPHEDVALYNN